MVLEPARGRGADRRDECAREGARVFALVLDLAPQPLHAVVAGEGHQVIAAELFDGFRHALGLGRWLDDDRRERHAAGAAAAQQVQGGLCLVGRARDEDAFAEQRLALVPIEPAAQRDDVPDDEQARAGDALLDRLVGDVGQLAHHDALARIADPLHYGGGRGGGAAGVDHQAAGDLMQAPRAHQDAQRALGAAKLRPVEDLTVALHRGDAGDAAGELTVGQRDAGVGGGADGGAHAGYHLEGDGRLAQGAGFFGSAAEEERVTALEPHDGFVAARERDELVVDALLGGVFGLAVVAALAHAAHFGVGGVAQDGVVDELVVEHDVGAGEELGGAQGQQPGIAGAGSHEVDPTGTRAAHAPGALHGARPMCQAPGVRWLFVAGLLVLTGCTAGEVCPRPEQEEPVEFHEGFSPAPSVYMTAEWDTTELLHFPGGAFYEIHHNLGEIPTEWLVYLSFERDGNNSASLALAAGNQAELKAMDETTITLLNGSCSDYWMLVVVRSN